MDLIGLPPDWLDYETARERHRVLWCKDHGVPLAICGEAVLEGAELDRRTAKRKAWCKRQYEDEYSDQCTDEFLDQTRLRQAAWRAHRRIETAALPNLSLVQRDLRGANLSLARLEGADLSEARLDGAVLSFARLEGANLSSARLEGAVFWQAQLEEADLRSARLEGANLSFAQLERADLRSARLEGADLNSARLEGTDLSFVGLEGADLSSARLEGANLWQARLDASTSFSPATLRRAGLKDLDFTMLDLDPDVFYEAFGDETVKLPDGVTLHPDAPVDRELDFSEWIDEWRAWQKRNGYTTE